MLEKFITLMLVGRDEEKGATAVEYGLMVALIAVVIIGAVTTLGGNARRACSPASPARDLIRSAPSGLDPASTSS